MSYYDSDKNREENESNDWKIKQSEDGSVPEPSQAIDFFEHLKILKENEGDIDPYIRTKESIIEENELKNKSKFSESELDMVKQYENKDSSIKVLSVMPHLCSEDYPKDNDDILYIHKGEHAPLEQVNLNTIKSVRVKIQTCDKSYKIVPVEKSYFNTCKRVLKVKRSSDNLPQCITPILEFLNYKENASGLFRISSKMQNNSFMLDYPVVFPYIFMYVHIEHVTNHTVSLENLSGPEFRKKVIN